MHVPTPLELALRSIRIPAEQPRRDGLIRELVFGVDWSHPPQSGTALALALALAATPALDAGKALRS